MTAPAKKKPLPPKGGAPAPVKKPMLDPKGVYLVESDVDPTALIARHAGIREGHVFWDDTNRERVQGISKAAIGEGGVVTVQTRQPGLVYRFTPLTLELYEAKVRHRVELSPHFESTKDLVEFYRTTAF